MPAASSTDIANRWKERFRAPVASWTQIARAEPARGLAVSNPSGVFQLHAWDVPTGELRQLTHRPEGLFLGRLSPDGRYAYYLGDEGGDERGHYMRAPFEGGAPENVTPGMPPYSSYNLGFSRSGNAVGFTAADSEGFRVCLAALDGGGGIGDWRELYHTKGFAFGPVLSHGGELAVVASTERTGEHRFGLLALNAATGERVGELWEDSEGGLSPLVFSPVAGDLRLLARTDRTGVGRPLLWDPRSGERTDLALEGVEGEVAPADWSADGRRILLCHTYRAVQRLCLYDLAADELALLDHPAGMFLFFEGFGTYFGPGGEIYAQWQDSTHPPQLIALDAATGARTRTVLAGPEVPPGRPLRSVIFPSSDGHEVQGWLGVPEGEGQFSTVLHAHGGPHVVRGEEFDPGALAWLDKGFAYLSVNYRGSTTFGREFERKIYQEPGRWELEDLAAARDWLVAEGVARPDQVLLSGTSHGAFLTLLALGRQPELWAGGMAVMAVADWAMLYEDSVEVLRGWVRTLFGGTPEENPVEYAAASPIAYAENVSAPVLIIQGRNDSRTPARPIEAYEERLRALGKPVEVEWFDAGHQGAFARAEQAIEHQELMMRSARRMLVGT